MDSPNEDQKVFRPWGYEIRKYLSNKPDTEDKTFSKRTMTENPSKYKGYIGIEYVVKYLEKENTPPRYECTLCKIAAAEEQMEHHVKTTFHRIEFLKQHFQQAMKKCFRIKEPKRSIVLEGIARAIEEHHGRNLPYDATMEAYEENRGKVIIMVGTFLHASEHNGPSFENLTRIAALRTYFIQKGLPF